MQFTILTFQSFKHFTYQPSRPAHAFFWMLSPDASAVLIWGFLCLDMALKTQWDKKKTARKNVRKSREGESRREREKTKENEFLPGRRYGQVTRAVMEADTACIPISDLPIRVACLFRGRQIRTPRWDNSQCQVVKLIHPCGRQMCWTQAEWQQSCRI